MLYGGLVQTSEEVPRLEFNDSSVSEDILSNESDKVKHIAIAAEGIQVSMT